MAELIITADENELLDSMVRSMSNEELFEFITDLDMLIADWDFTEALYAYFKNEHKTFKAEQKEWGL